MIKKYYYLPLLYAAAVFVPIIFYFIGETYFYVPYIPGSGLPSYTPVNLHYLLIPVTIFISAVVIGLTFRVMREETEIKQSKVMESRAELLFGRSKKKSDKNAG